LKIFLRRKKPQKRIAATLSEAEATPAAAIPTICPVVRTGWPVGDGAVAARELVCVLETLDGGGIRGLSVVENDVSGGCSDGVDRSAAAVTIEPEA
jgi:hypothetical protein